MRTRRRRGGSSHRSLATAEPGEEQETGSLTASGGSDPADLDAGPLASRDAGRLAEGRTGPRSQVHRHPRGHDHSVMPQGPSGADGPTPWFPEADTEARGGGDAWSVAEQGPGPERRTAESPRVARLPSPPRGRCVPSPGCPPGTAHRVAARVPHCCRAPPLPPPRPPARGPPHTPRELWLLARGI